MDIREITVIRHAPSLNDGRLAGRSDPPCDRDAALAAGDATRRLLPQFGARPGDHLLISPARRCVETTSALFPDSAAPAFPRSTDASLWEQDFGAWENMAYGDLPDPGASDRAGLARHCPPGGESFVTMAARAIPAIVKAAETARRLVVVAHAGTVRAVLGHALGDVAAGIAFSVEPLSLTRLRFAAGAPASEWGIVWVNRPAPPLPEAPRGPADTHP